MDERTDGTVVVEQAAQVAETEQGVEVSTLFGERRTIEGCSIGEVNLLDNYVILKRRESDHG
jgi:predicted RNA-binding protein